MYADFLEEACDVIGKQELKEIAEQFQASAATWRELANTLLPGEVTQLRETRELLVHRNRLFIEQGAAAMDEMLQINARLDAIKAEVRLVLKYGTSLCLENGYVDRKKRSRKW